ncbi:hypothetical protein B0H16DRAFT_1800674 [Mycena metata]|uniref:Uncharacterized protein n=1 Tax=Mycena metata TaxID=1033252 RepID=A0AAD7HB87_9AGAR|nr:hypothetical protein B0H16DRAFT_1800674 [Mycena metata]
MCMRSCVSVECQYLTRWRARVRQGTRERVEREDKGDGGARGHNAYTHNAVRHRRGRAGAACTRLDGGGMRVEPRTPAHSKVCTYASARKDEGEGGVGEGEGRDGDGRGDSTCTHKVDPIPADPTGRRGCAAWRTTREVVGEGRHTARDEMERESARSRRRCRGPGWMKTLQIEILATGDNLKLEVRGPVFLLLFASSNVLSIVFDECDKSPSFLHRTPSFIVLKYSRDSLKLLGHRTRPIMLRSTRIKVLLVIDSVFFVIRLRGRLPDTHRGQSQVGLYALTYSADSELCVPLSSDATSS